MGYDIKLMKIPYFSNESVGCLLQFKALKKGADSRAIDTGYVTKEMTFIPVLS